MLIICIHVIYTTMHLYSFLSTPLLEKMTVGSVSNRFWVSKHAGARMVTAPLEVSVVLALLSVSTVWMFPAVALAWREENERLAVARQVVSPLAARVPGIAACRKYRGHSLQTPTS